MWGERKKTVFLASLPSLALCFQPHSRPFVWLLARTWIRKNTDCFAVYGWSGLFYPPNELNFQFCWFNLIFLIAPSWSESNFILFLFFYSIRVGPSRSELIRPRLAVRVDPVQLLYLPSVKRSLLTIIFTMQIRMWLQQSHCVLTLKTIVHSLHFIQPHCQVGLSILYPLLPIPLPPPHLLKDGWHPNPQFFVDILWKMNFQEFGFCWHFWKYVQRVLSREYWQPLFKILRDGAGCG